MDNATFKSLLIAHLEERKISVINEKPVIVNGVERKLELYKQYVHRDEVLGRTLLAIDYTLEETDPKIVALDVEFVPEHGEGMVEVSLYM